MARMRVFLVAILLGTAGAAVLADRPILAGSVCRFGVCVSVPDSTASKFIGDGSSTVKVGNGSGGTTTYNPGGSVVGGGGGGSSGVSGGSAGVRDYLKSIGFTDGQIGWDSSSGKVTVDGKPLDIADLTNNNGITYASPEAINKALQKAAQSGGGSSGGQSQTPGQGNAVNLGGTSYYSSNGYAVAWAGGNDIVVFDSKGNKVWEGAGERRPDGRIVPPSTVQNNIGFGSAPIYGTGNPQFFGSGGSNAAGGGRETGVYAGQSKSPFPNAPNYAGMQPVTLTLADGRKIEGYANVYSDANGLGYSAIPETSHLGQKLKVAGAPIRDGQVLIHSARNTPGLSVSWEAAIQPGYEEQARGAGLWGPSTSLVGPADLQGVGGGFISITIGGGGGGSVIFPPTIQDIAFSASPVRFGEWLTVTIRTVSYTDAVTVRVNHRRDDLPADRFQYAALHAGGTSPGQQTWTARVRVDWITKDEFQTAMQQQDGSQEWLDACRCAIEPYAITVSATGRGGTSEAQAGVTVRGTVLWVVPVPWN